MRRRAQNSQKVKVRVKNHFVQSVASTGTALSIDTNNLGNVVNNLSGIYRYYRITHFELTIHPNPSPSAGNYVCAMYVGADDQGMTTPSGINAMESEASIAMSTEQTVPARLKIPDMVLRGINEWYLTKLDATDPALDIQGTLYLLSAATHNVLLTYDITIEFKEIVDSDVVSAALQQYRQKVSSKTCPPAKSEGKSASTETCGCCHNTA